MTDNKYDNPFKIPTSINTEVDENLKDKRLKKIKTEDEDFPQLKGLNIKLPPKLHEELKIYCITINETIQDYILSLIKKDLKKNK